MQGTKSAAGRSNSQNINKILMRILKGAAGSNMRMEQIQQQVDAMIPGTFTEDDIAEGLNDLTSQDIVFISMD